MMKRFSPALAPSIERPPSFASWLAPGACVTSVVKSRPFGSSSTCSARMFVCRALCRTSTSGDSAVTCTDSVTPSGDSAKSTFLTWPRPTRTASFFAGAKLSRRRGDDVIARGDGREAVGSGFVRRRRQHHARGGARLHGHAGQNCARCVLDDAFDGATLFLGRNRPGKQQSRHQCG